jgi:hypothetical protein
VPNPVTNPNSVYSHSHMTELTSVTKCRHGKPMPGLNPMLYVSFVFVIENWKLRHNILLAVSRLWSYGARCHIVLQRYKYFTWIWYLHLQGKQNIILPQRWKSVGSYILGICSYVCGHCALKWECGHTNVIYCFVLRNFELTLSVESSKI